MSSAAKTKTMKTRTLVSREMDSSKVRTSVVLEYKVMMTGTVNGLDTAAMEFNKAMEAFYARCERLDVSVAVAHGFVRSVSHDEALTLIQRKYHLKSADGRQACRTSFVSEKYLTDDEAAVTCKLCLKGMHP